MSKPSVAPAGAPPLELPADVAALLPAWLQQALCASGPCCPLRPIVTHGPSRGYRNKSSFSPGLHGTTGQPAMGHRVASYASSTATVVLPPEEAGTGASPLVPPCVPRLLAALNAFFFGTSPLAIHDVATHAGPWRGVTVRHSDRTGEVAVILEASPPLAGAGSCSSCSGEASTVFGAGAEAANSASTPAAASSDAVYAAELQRFVDVCRGAEITGSVESVAATSSATEGCSPASPPPLRVVCVCVQEYPLGVSVAPPSLPHRLLWGQPFLTERLGGLQFRVSPGAFFQVNTPAAEAMYDTVRRLAVLGAEETVEAEGAADSAASTAGGGCAAPLPHLASTALLDVCCGTGTIGLLCAPHFGRVVGVELEAAAVRDAEANAALNGLAGVAFVCDRAENVMADVIARASSSAAQPDPGAVGGAAAASITRVVAVVDPPRGGLHPAVVRALRTCRPLQRLVYVSCNPTGSFLEDAVKLCTPYEHSSAFARGVPFRPVLAVPVDMFPQTKLTELVLLFERVA